VVVSGTQTLAQYYPTHNGHSIAVSDFKQPKSCVKATSDFEKKKKQKKMHVEVLSDSKKF